MIVFDLDCLFNDKNIRHFIDPKKCIYAVKQLHYNDGHIGAYYDTRTKEVWKPDYESYYDSELEIYKATAKTMFRHSQHSDVQIWSGVCESQRKDVQNFIYSQIPYFAPISWYDKNLKMRPIGLECTPERLFEHWATQCDCSNHPRMNVGDVIRSGDIKNSIEMAFSSYKPTINMLRKRGVFVFDCNQEIL